MEENISWINIIHAIKKVLIRKLKEAFEGSNKIFRWKKLDVYGRN